ncbi:MAG: hypothetical protein LBS07_06460 [Prevotellaceae bacterium]|jgi:hypothetical protein|nr:hypothetical protein [Prevotellaceae bacterium]
MAYSIFYFLKTLKESGKKQFKLAGLLFFMIPASCTLPEAPPDNVTLPEAPPDNVTSPYISQVFEYAYAPGQHAALAKSDEAAVDFTGKPENVVYLGGFGGYITAGFDHNVENREGYDFEIYALGVDGEPGVVFVMNDDNGDGIPNETWYELTGSESGNSVRNYRICYRKAVSDNANITWTDNQGNSGELISGYNGKYSSSWWWSETAADSVVFTGTKLPEAYENIGLDGNQYWQLKAGMFQWGYADNPKGTDYDKSAFSNKFDISDAVDGAGKAAGLTSIRFIKIQSAVLQQAGWLNEISPELRGVKDLHY